MADVVTLHLPHHLSTERISAEHFVDNEEGWPKAGEKLNNFFCPNETLLDVYNSGRWKIDKWVIDGLVRAGSICLMAGASNVGKTYLALDLAVCVAMKEAFLGDLVCDVGPVVYVGGEGDKAMLLRRLVGILRGRGYNENEFFRTEMWKRIVISMPSDYAHKVAYPLANVGYISRLMENLSQIPKQNRPKLFIFDPLSALVPDVDRDPSKVKEVINNLRNLNILCDSCSMILHHLKKVQANAPTDHRNLIRGESSWINFVDDVLVAEGDPEKPDCIQLWSNKARDSKSPKDGAPVKSLVRTFESLADDEVPGSSPGAIQRVKHFHISVGRREQIDERLKSDEKFPDMILSVKTALEQIGHPATVTEIAAKIGVPSSDLQFADAVLQLSRDGLIARHFLADSPEPVIGLQ